MIAGYEGLKQWDRAHDMHSNARQLEPNSTAAEAALQRCAAKWQESELQAADQKAAAAVGLRSPMPCRAVAESDAAQLLLTADAILQQNPGLEAAKCSRVEALILCGRLQDALEAANGLLEGQDKAYMQAEAYMRSGDPSAAAQLLRQAQGSLQPGIAPAAKIQDLLQRSEAAQEALQAAERSLDCRQYQRCTAACDRMLELWDPRLFAGLVCKVLHLRVCAYCAAGEYSKALADACEAVKLQCSNADCLWLRGQVYKALERHLEAFADLRNVKKLQPDRPGLQAELCAAAMACARRQGSSSSSSSRNLQSNALLQSFAALGLNADAPPGMIRAAYLRQAAQWHPDKWMSASREQRQAAEDRFKAIGASYHTLSEAFGD